MQTLHRFRTSAAALLFQQSCRAASRSSSKISRHQQSALTSGPRGGQEPPNSEVRWFEQDLETGTVNRLAEHPEKQESLVVRNRIKHTRSELNAYDADPNSAEFQDLILADLPRLERAKVCNVLEKRRQRRNTILQGLDLDHRRADERHQARNIKRFNFLLHKAVETPSEPETAQSLWAEYRRLKQVLPRFTSLLSENAWKVLWSSTRSTSMSTANNANERVAGLLADMAASGVRLSQEQVQSRIDALLALGRDDDAVKIWTQEHEELHPAPLETLKRGIAIFSKIGNIDMTRSLVHEVYTNHPDQDASSILPLLQLLAQSGRVSATFELYKAARAYFGQKMTMSDYDTCVAAFLQQNHKELALAVFRDMMLQGCNTAQLERLFPTKTPDQLGAMFPSTTHDRFSATLSVIKDGPDLDSQTLANLSRLPRRWQNKYFYASWIKKLIGDNEPVQAAQAVQLMQVRGIQPDAIHINGLIGAYFRNGDAELQSKGESLAKTMIQLRLDFVSRKISNQEAMRGGRLPMANIEVFNVLILHYLVKQRWEDIRRLEADWKESRLRMSTYFMNKLLFTTLYTNGPGHTWRDFKHYTGLAPTGSHFVNPPADMETFECLWSAALQHVVRHPSVRDDLSTVASSGSSDSEPAFPSPRFLFRTMIVWHQKLTSDPSASSRDIQTALAGLTADVYATMVQTFISKKDFAGLVVAMHVLADRFKVFPDADTIQLLADGLANIFEPRVAATIRGRKGTRRALVSDSQRRRGVDKVVDVLVKRREEVARGKGVDFETLSTEEKARLDLRLLADLTRFVVERATGGKIAASRAEETDKAWSRAASEMGVPDIEVQGIE